MMFRVRHCRPHDREERVRYFATLPEAEWEVYRLRWWPEWEPVIEVPMHNAKGEGPLWLKFLATLRAIPSGPSRGGAKS